MNYRKRSKISITLLTFVMMLTMFSMVAFADENNTPQVIDTDTTWNDSVELTKDLIVEEGVTLTIKDQIQITGDVTISGGGTIKSDSLIPGHQIDGTTYNNMILVTPNNQLTLENITIDGGAVWGNEDTEESALLGHSLTNSGIQRQDARSSLVQACKDSTVYIKNNTTLQNNDAPKTAGAAIRSDHTKTYIEDGAVIQNNRASSGSVLQLEGTLSMSGGQISGNIAADANGQGGGGLRVQANAEITGGEITNNISNKNGGGIAVTWTTDYSVSISDIRVSHNKAILGGAIYNTYDSDMILEDSTLSQNIAESGAGISADSAAVTMKNVRFIDNTAKRGAGLSGIGPFYFDSCTMTGNSAYAAPAIHTLGNNTFFGGNTTIKDNTILQGSESGSPYSGDAQVLVGDKGMFLFSPLTGEGIEDIDFNTADISSLNPIVSGDAQYSVTKDDVAKLGFVSRFYEDTSGKEYGIFEKDGIANRYEVTTVTFHSNYSGSDDVETQKVPIGCEIDLEANSFRRPGYVFKNWNTKKDNSGTTYANEAEITTSKAVDLYAQWANLKTDDISMEYGLTRKLPTIKDVVLSNLASDDETIVKIEGEKLKAVGTGKTTITADAKSAITKSTEKITINVNVTPMLIIYGDSDSNKVEFNDGHPFLEYAQPTNGIAPQLNEYLWFYHAVKQSDGTYKPEPNTNIELEQGTDIKFVYTQNNQTELSLDVLPFLKTDGSEPIDVDIKLLNKNYQFVSSKNGKPDDSLKLRVKVHAENMTKETLLYDGTPLDDILNERSVEYTGEGVAPKLDLTSVSAEGIKEFTVHFHSVDNDVSYDEHVFGEAGELTESAIRKAAPTELGVYSMVINGQSDTKYAYSSCTFEIIKGTPEGEPVFESANESKKLSDIVLSGSMKNTAGLDVSGTFIWTDEPDQMIEQDKSYHWTFTPDDTDHYNTVSGSSIIWQSSDEDNEDPQENNNHPSADTDSNASSDDKTESNTENPSGSSTGDSSQTNESTPRTSDNNQPVFWIAFLIISILSMSIVLRIKRETQIRR